MAHVRRKDFLTKLVCELVSLPVSFHPLSFLIKRQIEREKKVAEVREAEEKTQAEALAQRLEATEIEIARRVGENNTLYGSVTSADIAHALEAKGFQIDKRKITLADPIKAVGDVTVPLKIHREVTAQLKVKVVPDTH